MDVVPAPTIVTQPELSTVATDVSVEYQIPAPSGTLLTNKKLFPTRSKFCTGGSMVSVFAVVVVVEAVVKEVCVRLVDEPSSSTVKLVELPTTQTLYPYPGPS